jgi:competence protein ComEC
MPRAAWVAAGAIVAALTAAEAETLGVPAERAAAVLLAAAALSIVCARVVATRRPPRYGPRNQSLLPAVVGVILVAIRVLVASPAPAAGPTALPDGDGPWVATVATVGSPRDGRQVATLALEKPPDETLRVAATLPRYPPIRPGLVVTVGGSLEPIRDDDYGRYLTGVGVSATVRASSLAVVGESGDTADVVEGVRRAADDALTRALPEPEAGLAAGILIGLRDRVDRDLASAFVVAGVSHVVAISGWNIAIVGAAIAALLGRWPRRRRSIATLGATAVYTILTGASASVLRAAVMAAVVLLARESGRPGRAATALGWAVAGLLITGPSLVTDPGFALSAAATGGLIAWATPLTKRLKLIRGGVIPGWLCSSLGVSLAAEAATLPIALLWFGRVPIVAPLVNLAVVPVVAPAMAAGAIALVGGFVAAAGAPGITAVVLGLPAWAALAFIVGIVRAAAVLPFASATLEPPLNVAAAGAASLVMVAIVGRDEVRRAVSRLRARPAATKRTRAVDRAIGEGGATPRPGATAGRRPAMPAMPPLPVRLVAAALAVAIVALVAVAATRPDGRLRITVLDVGQGDAILVDADRGSRMLIDGGPDPDRLLVALDAHVPPWDRRIDLVVLSHPHEDHVAGLALLMARYRVGRVVEPGMRGPGPGYRAWVSTLEAQGVRSGRLATGDAFIVDDVAFRVLWPDRGAVPPEPPDTGTGINNVSIVLLGTFGHERFLLAGDIEEGIDPILLGRGLPRVDFLKVAHHGSRTSSTAAFLDAVHPRVAAVSVGAKNPYGHPAPATIGRLRERGIRVFRTDLDGSVDITLDGHALTAGAEGGRTAGSGPDEATATATASATRYACGIVRIGPGPSRPAVAAVTAPVAPPDTTPAATLRIPRTQVDPASPQRPDQPRSVAPSVLLYHRADVGPRAGGRRRAAPLARSAAVGAPARPCRRRGRRLARRSHRSPGHPDRSAPRRGGRPPP